MKNPTITINGVKLFAPTPKQVAEATALSVLGRDLQCWPHAALRQLCIGMAETIADTCDALAEELPLHRRLAHRRMAGKLRKLAVRFKKQADQFKEEDLIGWLYDLAI